MRSILSSSTEMRCLLMNFWTIFLCVSVLPPIDVSVSSPDMFPHQSLGSRPPSTQSNQSVQSPSTHPRRHTSRLNSSRLLWSNMRSSPCDRLISRSSKDRSVSGSSSALSGQRERFVRTFTYVCVLCMLSMCRQSSAYQRHSCKHTNTHLLGHDLSDIIGKQGRVFLLLVWWSVNRQILWQERQCQHDPVVMWNCYIINLEVHTRWTIQEVLLTFGEQNHWPLSPWHYEVGIKWAIRS